MDYWSKKANVFQNKNIHILIKRNNVFLFQLSLSLSLSLSVSVIYKQLKWCLLLSDISREAIHLTPWMQDSSTWAPIEPRLLPLMSSSKPTVLSLQAKPSRRCLSASRGSLQNEMFKYLRERVAVKNCLKLGGISLVFLLEKELRATFKWTRFVAQPRSKAPKSCEITINVHF
jgi:hypothetical protein